MTGVEEKEREKEGERGRERARETWNGRQHSHLLILPTNTCRSKAWASAEAMSQ